MMEQVYLLLGSNEGNREDYIRQASGDLSFAASGPIESSSFYETAAWGLEEQPPFLNVALGFQTSWTPEALLNLIRETEAKYGRQRQVVWGQRTLDVDILFFGNRVIHTPELAVPHPRLQDRRFALVPLAELASGLVHPVLEKTIDELLAICPDPLPVAQMG